MKYLMLAGLLSLNVFAHAGTVATTVGSTTITSGTGDDKSSVCTTVGSSKICN